jgi:hypothetical protein
MNAITTSKIALITALDEAGWGFSGFGGQVFSSLGSGAVQFQLYPLPKAATPAVATAAQKAALINALTKYNVSLQDAQVFDEVNSVTVPGLMVTLVPIAESTAS